MANLPEESQWEDGIYRVEKTDDVLGDDSNTISGPINAQSQQLGNRTKYLKDLIDAHNAASDPHAQYIQASELDALLGSTAISGLPHPTIETIDNKMPVIAATAVDGGTVTVAAGTYLSLCREIVTGISGRTELHETPDFTSADLDVNSTYFLRAHLDSSGDLQIYTTKGSDTDSIPATLRGTVNGANGGGFDSTVFDALLAKIVTAGAGTEPVVTSLVNRNSLAHSEVYDIAYTAGNGSWINTNYIYLNWARKPGHVNVSLAGFKNVGGGAWDGSSNPDTIYKCAVQGTDIDRYRVRGRVTWADAPSVNGQMLIDWLMQSG